MVMKWILKERGGFWYWPRSNDDEIHPQSTTTINDWSSGEKSDSKLQNANGNYGMVKMNSETALYSHLITCKLNLLLWIWFYYVFYHETGIFNPFDVVLNRQYN